MNPAPPVRRMRRPETVGIAKEVSLMGGKSPYHNRTGNRCLIGTGPDPDSDAPAS